MVDNCSVFIKVKFPVLACQQLTTQTASLIPPKVVFIFTKCLNILIMARLINLKGGNNDTFEIWSYSEKRK